MFCDDYIISDFCQELHFFHGLPVSVRDVFVVLSHSHPWVC